MSAKRPTTRAQYIAAALSHIDTASRVLAHPRGHHCDADNLRAAADALAILRCLTGQKPDLTHASQTLELPAVEEPTRISIEMEMNKAEALRILGLYLLRTDNHVAARHHLEEALSITELRVGKDANNVCIILGGLIRSYQRLDEHTKLERAADRMLGFFQDAPQLMRESLGLSLSDNPVLALMQIIAGAACANGNPLKAISFYEEIRRRGWELFIWQNEQLAECYIRVRSFTAAASNLERALAAKLSIYGERAATHHDVKELRARLVQVYAANGQFARAQALASENLLY